MPKIVYIPAPADNDETTVDGIRFQAYEPVEIDGAQKAALIAKLLRNPYFADADAAPSPEQEARATEWHRVRAAQAAARLHRGFADLVENDPSAAHNAPAIEDAQSKAHGIVADAQAKARDLLRQASAEADHMLASAEAMVHGAGDEAPAPDEAEAPKAKGKGKGKASLN